MYEPPSGTAHPSEDVVRDTEAVRHPAATKPRILFVEDEPALCGYFVEALSDEYSVDIAGSGTEALRLVLHTKPDLVVTDIVMPEMDGVELLRTLRSVPSTQSIPVLLISGHAGEEQRIDGFQKGANGYLAKPYSERELRALIGSMIQSTRQRAEDIRRQAFQEAERRAVAERAALLESITDAFYALDAHYRFTYINQRALDHFGKAREEMLGRSIWEVLPALAGSPQQEQYERALRTQVSAAIECPSLITGHWLDVRIYPAADGLAVYFRDVSDRKRAEQALQAALLRLENREWRLELATRVAGLGVFTWHVQSDHVTFDIDPPPDVLQLSRAAPLTAARLFDEILHPDDRRALLRRIARCIRKSDPVRSLCRVRNVEGTWRWLEINAGRESDSQGTMRIVGVVADVTERQQAEEAMREADSRKDEFLALLSHELRNPLAPIVNGLAVLRYRCQPDSIVQRTLATMHRQLSHLLRLVNDLLDMERIRHGKLRLRLEYVRLTDVVARAIEACRPLLEARQHELATEIRTGDIVVRADPDRIEQAITNLIQNAAKFTRPGGHIGIVIDSEGGNAVVAVTDSGIGIPADRLDRIFEMFAKTGEQLPQFGGGLGIGLASARNVLEMHRGTIRAASPGPGMGSSFTIRLPHASGGLASLPVEAPDPARGADPGDDPTHP